MPHRLLAPVTLVLTLAVAGTAGAGTPGGAHQQPYAGPEERGIKALSEQEIADLRAGRGMGLALAAELNGYPGPLHVLEHADALALSSEQRDRTAALFGSMKAEAMALGERLVAEERRLDRLFADRAVDEVSLRSATVAIGAVQGELRASHLRYHLAMAELLTPEQIRRYAELRGYGAAGAGHHGHHRAPAQ